MNIDHLKPDELSVELMIRNLPSAGQSSLDQLRSLLVLEAQDPSRKPTLLHHESVTTENRAVAARINELKEEIAEAVRAADESRHAKLLSRWYHVADRSDRLLGYGGKDFRVAIEALRGELSQLLFMGSPSPAGELLGFEPAEITVPSVGVCEPGPSSHNRPEPAVALNTIYAQLETLTQVVQQLRIGGGNVDQIPNSPRNVGIPVREPAPRQSFPIRPLNNSHFLSKWTIRYSGDSRGLSLEEFIFRVEALAAANNVATGTLVLGLHYLLEGRAESWYWLELRKHPDASWIEFSEAFRGQFGTVISDCDIRRDLYSRTQGPNEKFADFRLAMESLSVRLARPLSEAELIDVLRHNMSRRLQSALMLQVTNTVAELSQYCVRFEGLWYRPADVSVGNKLIRNHGIYELEPEPLDLPISVEQPRILAPLVTGPGPGDGARNDYQICWNCKDMGHTFHECMSATRNVFCFGCGRPETYKPTCPRCSPGNRKSSPARAAPLRSNPNPFRRQ